MARDYHLTQTGEETQEAINKILALDIATTDTPGLMSGEDKAILDALPSEVSDKANRASDATNGHLASLDASGDLVDSGKSVYDFATKEQGTLADSAYQKPENGIPASDMAPGVIPDVSDVVRTSVQSLSDGDKSQARENIGAASEGALEGKVDKVEGKGLSTNDYTDEDKSRVAYLPTALAGLGDAIRAKYTKPSTGIPASDIEDGVIPDVSNFITKSVDDLVNYYLKSETYTKDEVAALIGAIQQFHYEIYASRQDVVSPANNVLYLIGPTGSGADKYEEYVYDSTKQDPWVKIGDTSIDLSGYVTTTALNTALAAYTTSADLATLLAAKQDVIADLADIRSGAAAGATAYQKPSTGIPKTDMAQAVQDSLDLANSALQSFTETDPTVPLWAKAASKPTYTAQEVGALPANTPIPSALADLSEDTTHRVVTDTEKATWNGKYSKPTNGIPASDLASGVIPDVSGFYTKPQGGIPATDLADKYAGSPTAGGFANKTVAIPFGSVDASSTATELTATVDNFPATLADGVCAYIRNDAVASASGFTLNINGTGALPVYQTMADATRSTTVFAATTTYLFVYNSSRVEGGCWDIYYGYNSNDNTIGYNLRTNGASTPPAASKFYRYRLLFLSPDGQSLIPANTSTSTSATTSKTVNQAKIDPFAPIWYYSTTTAINAGSSASASYLWMQYNGIALGYSFNRVGAALTMTARDPVYLKCAPQSDGSAIMDADTPIVQALPSTEDGKIYIFLGYAESATNITLYYHHPVYYFKDGAIRLWTNAKEVEANPTVPSGTTPTPMTGLKIGSGYYSIEGGGGAGAKTLVTALSDYPADEYQTQDFATLASDWGITTEQLRALLRGEYERVQFGPHTATVASIRDDDGMGFRVVSVLLIGDTKCFDFGSFALADYSDGATGWRLQGTLPTNRIDSSQPYGGFLPNVPYFLGTLSGNTTFSLQTPTDQIIANHYFWTFMTGSTAPTITWPSGIAWNGGSAPTINAQKYYEISILNNRAVWIETDLLGGIQDDPDI